MFYIFGVGWIMIEDDGVEDVDDVDDVESIMVLYIFGGFML